MGGWRNDGSTRGNVWTAIEEIIDDMEAGHFDFPALAGSESDVPS